MTRLDTRSLTHPGDSWRRGRRSPGADGLGGARSNPASTRTNNTGQTATGLQDLAAALI